MLELKYSDYYEAGQVTVRVDCYELDGRPHMYKYFYEINNMFSVELTPESIVDTKTLIDSVLEREELNDV